MEYVRAIRLMATLQLELEYTALEEAKPAGVARLTPAEVEAGASCFNHSKSNIIDLTTVTVFDSSVRVLKFPLVLRSGPLSVVPRLARAQPSPCYRRAPSRCLVRERAIRVLVLLPKVL